MKVIVLLSWPIALCFQIYTLYFHVCIYNFHFLIFDFYLWFFFSFFEGAKPMVYLCRTPLLEECPQHHGHKRDLE